MIAIASMLLKAEAKLVFNNITIHSFLQVSLEKDKGMDPPTIFVTKWFLLNVSVVTLPQ